mmetsp:Transcript_99800/g.291202  ORF Transcript_99800/g.291202 Transcript_99800/m.291202 type:complete len:136 (+) Transcript_99800:59-466(+)
MVYSADDFSLTRPESRDREIQVTTYTGQPLVLRGGDLWDAATPTVTVMLAAGVVNLLPEDEDERSMGDECIAYRLGPQADKRGRVLQAAEPCRATGARKTYWKTLMVTMAGCCTPTMATDTREMEQPMHDTQRRI